MRRVQHDLDLESVILDARELVTEPMAELPASIEAKTGPEEARASHPRE